MQIIGLVGFIGSGKDTVANQFVKQGCVRFSFASSLKDAVACIFGWNRYLLEGDTIESREFRETTDIFWTRRLGIPNFTPRLALQLIGTDVMRNHFNQDIWLHSLEYQLLKLSDTNKPVIISDARVRNELDLIKRMDGSVIWVNRGELPSWYDIAVLANSGSAAHNKIMKTQYCDVHVSEWNWVGYEVDSVIRNAGTLHDLDTQVISTFTNLYSPVAA